MIETRGKAKTFPLVYFHNTCPDGSQWPVLTVVRETLYLNGGNASF